MHNLHFFRNIVWNMSRIFPCLLEFFMSRICPVLFVQNLSRIFYVQNLSSFICLEFVWNFLCLEFVQFHLSRICLKFFHVQNMSGKNFWNFSCPDFVQFICPDFVQIFCMSGICPENFSGIFFMSRICPVFWAWKNSRHQIWSFFRTFSGSFPDMKNKFWTISLTFSGHFFFIGQLNKRK